MEDTTTVTNVQATQAIKPGTISFLPSSTTIPLSSRVHVEFRDANQSYFAHPLVVIAHDPTTDVVEFLPLVSRLLEPSKNYVWPRNILILEPGPRVEDSGSSVQLAAESKGLGQMFWIASVKGFCIEACFLRQFPVEGRGLAEDAVFFDQEGLARIVSLHQEHGAHAPCQRLPQGVPASNIRPGVVVRLPQSPPPSSIIHRQFGNAFERPLGHPFVVTKMDGPVARGYPLTSFNSKPIAERYAHKDEQTAWIRSNYLIIEGSAAEAHDGLPVVFLSPGSRQMKNCTYVHTAKQFAIESHFLEQWGGHGVGEEVFVREDMIEVIEKHSKAMEGWKKPRNNRLQQRGRSSTTGDCTLRISPSPPRMQGPGHYIPPTTAHAAPVPVMNASHHHRWDSVQMFYPASHAQYHIQPNGTFQEVYASSIPISSAGIHHHWKQTPTVPWIDGQNTTHYIPLVAPQQQQQGYYGSYSEIYGSLPGQY